jgi:hypothetical protein
MRMEWRETFAAPRHVRLGGIIERVCRMEGVDVDVKNYPGWWREKISVIVSGPEDKVQRIKRAVYEGIGYGPHEASL